MFGKSSKSKGLGVRKRPTATKGPGVQSSITKFLISSKSPKRPNEQKKRTPTPKSSLLESITPQPTTPAPSAAHFARTTFSTRSSAPAADSTQASSVPASPSSANQLSLPSRRHRNPAPAAPVVIDCTADDDLGASVPEPIINTTPQVDAALDSFVDLSWMDEENAPEPATHARRGWRRGYRNRARRGRRRGGWRGGSRERSNATPPAANCSTFYNHYDTGSGMMCGDSLGIDFGGGGSWEGVGCMGMGNMAGEEMNHDDFD
ncbi:hypothetical protein BSKO_01311 [Bryopsis sp. KO-2023]|nr:hypothetical protein BSKO_01311 [Bryopsis sp. KO-2023]